MGQTTTLEDELRRATTMQRLEELEKDFVCQQEEKADQKTREVIDRLWDQQEAVSARLKELANREVIDAIRSVKSEDVKLNGIPGSYQLPFGRVVKDSGERRIFSTGAQRDAGAGKGFFDCIPTMPLLRVAVGLGRPSQLELDHPRGSMIVHILQWKDGDNEQDHLAKACFLAFHQMGPTKDEYWGGIAYEGLERLAQLYEVGAVGKGYGKHNWKKGMPKSVFLNSLLRHAFKVGANWDDEDHLAAVIFNAFCLMHFEDLDWKAPDGTNLNDD